MRTMASDSASRRSPDPLRASQAEDQPAVSGRSPRAGFSGFKEAARKSVRSEKPGVFQVPYDTRKFIVFLEPENFDAVDQHWIDITTGTGRTVQVPRNCIANPAEGVQCPLCGIGHEPRTVALFNVVDLDDPGMVKIWEVSRGIFDKIVELAEELASIPEDRGGPLDLNSPGVYVSVSKKKKETASGRGGFTEYTLSRVKARDLEEDYGRRPLSPDEIDGLMETRYTSEDIEFPTESDLRQLTDEVPF